jgi:hypothetical protein
MIALFAAIIIVVIILYRLRPKTSREGESGNGWKIYGTMGCGWTRKQIDYMKEKGKPYTFIDCSKGGCDGMRAFPTSVSPTGEKVVGFKEL